MKSHPAFVSVLVLSLASVASAQPAAPGPAPSYPRPLRELNTSYFPFNDIGPITAETWAPRKQEIRDRILLASGLFPLPTRTPLNAVMHGRVVRDDYTIDRVFFESFPGHYVTGNLYLPKNPPKDGKMPGILSPHGHWPRGRFTDYGAGSAATRRDLAIGAERWESGARMPLHARCVQLARMGCAVFFYDMLGYADSIQITHRSGRRPELDGREPGTFGLFATAAESRLQSGFGLQTWNSIRALDFLLTVPGVDPARLSITGESGGGTQSMVLAAIDDRLATAFPCVMISTAMQGGCTCENASYLRINQGNIDIAAAFAPKPMGMTAANDWTKELEKKGFPDLKRVWKGLGQPDNVMATFNLHWAHNYNHVSRTTMYGFMNKHFNLGFTEPVLEREFVVPTTEEITVWTTEHPRPAGDQVGGAHEQALLKHWSDDSDRVIAGRGEVIARAWEIMVGRAPATPAEVKLGRPARTNRGSYVIYRGQVRNTKHDEEFTYTFVRPSEERWNGTIVLWLGNHAADPLTSGDEPSAAAQKLLGAGAALAIPELYLRTATRQPMNPARGRDPWQSAACYTYGYNPTLLAHRVHDVMTAVAAIHSDPVPSTPARIILAGTDGAGVVAAVAAALSPGEFAGAVIDTEGFRFAAVEDHTVPLFVPGAVKYGDVPALLKLCEPLQPTVLGEGGAKGGVEAVLAAVLKLAGGPRGSAN